MALFAMDGRSSITLPRKFMGIHYPLQTHSSPFWSNTREPLFTEKIILNTDIRYNFVLKQSVINGSLNTQHAFTYETSIFIYKTEMRERAKNNYNYHLAAPNSGLKCNHLRLVYMLRWHAGHTYITLLNDVTHAMTVKAVNSRWKQQ